MCTVDGFSIEASEDPPTTPPAPASSKRAPTGRAAAQRVARSAKTNTLGGENESGDKKTKTAPLLRRRAAEPSRDAVARTSPATKIPSRKRRALDDTDDAAPRAATKRRRVTSQKHAAPAPAPAPPSTSPEARVAVAVEERPCAEFPTHNFVTTRQGMRALSAAELRHRAREERLLSARLLRERSSQLSNRDLAQLLTGHVRLRKDACDVVPQEPRATRATRRSASPASHEPQTTRATRRSASPASHEPQTTKSMGLRSTTTTTTRSDRAP